MLQFFGFGNTITCIDWVKILNNDFKAAVSQCVFLSEQFKIQRGCRQGDPTAANLFITCTEILATVYPH